MKVLLIEDDESQRDLVIDILTTDGIEVKWLENLDSLLACLVEFAPDVVVTDILLPGVSGFSLIHVIHKNFPHIKILAYSAHAIPSKFEDFHDNAIKLGASEFIGKPYEIDVFIQKIRGLI